MDYTNFYCVNCGGVFTVQTDFTIVGYMRRTVVGTGEYFVGDCVCCGCTGGTLITQEDCE